MLFKIFEVVLVFLGLIHFKLYSSRYCYSDINKVKRYQFKKLKKLICVSYDEIEFYKNKYDKAGFNPHTDFNKISDMEKVPTLRKSEARVHQLDIVNHKRSKFALEFKTSGSTGNPFRALISPWHWVIEQSCVWRHWSWAGYRFRDRMAIIRSHVPKSENDLIKWDRARNFIYFSPFHLTDDHIKFYLTEMMKMRVKFLRGYPSSILAVADFIIRHPEVDVPIIKGVFTASERLGQKQKDKIEKAFKSKVFNHYGLAEQIVMFGGCEQGTHLHNYEEYGYLELAPTSDQTVKSIIGTNLNNYAMPLIRYETGDLAQMDGSSCACERTSPVLVNVVGRQDSTILLDDGSNVPVTNFYTMFEHYDKSFSAWQLVQESETLLSIILDVHQEINLKQLETSLSQDIKQRLGERINLSFDFSGNFKKVSGGKKNPFLRMF